MKSKSSPEWQSQTLMRLAVGALSILGEFNEEKKKLKKTLETIMRQVTTLSVNQLKLSAICMHVVIVIQTVDISL